MRISRPSQFFKTLGLTAALPISASLLMISMGKAQASGQYSKTCESIDTRGSAFQKELYLIAACRKRNGTYNNNASININELITNDNGHLRWQSRGDFGESCAVEGVNENVLLANCLDRNGNFVEDFIDLDEHIANINGELTYVK